MRTSYGAGMAQWTRPDQPLELAARHPAAHAGFLLDVDDVDGVVTQASMGVGFMHRGAEKLFESRDYRQAMMLANRHDWLSAIHSEVLIALALEESMGISVPLRAQWTRMLLMEANRIAVALAFLAPVLPESSPAFAVREQWISAQEAATGARVHPMYARIGGVAHGLGAAELDVFDSTRTLTHDAFDTIAAETAAYAESVEGLAVLSREAVEAYGVSGTIAQASGPAVDLRRDQPYLRYADVYDLLSPAAAHGGSGDAKARYLALAAQIPASLAIIGSCLDQLSSLVDDPYDVPLPKTVRAPEGTTYTSIEGPLGIMGCLLVSTADTMPYRLKLRTASFNNAQAMQVALAGTPVARLADAVMSFPFVVGDIDR